MNKIKGDNPISNLKYLSRNYYYGKLLDYEFVSGAMILKLACYTATEYFGGSVNVRVYVPTSLEEQLQRVLRINSNYFVIAAPYRVRFNKTYQHRTDMLINIFEEIL